MDREQFISHVKGSQKALRRFLVALCCGDAALADDIAQETLIKAYLSCDGFKNPDKFNAWIYRIDSADSSFRYQALYAALNRLPGKERTSVLLHYMEGYSIKEIAVITESSEDAVKQHLSRGRTHLRGLLVSPY